MKKIFHFIPCILIFLSFVDTSNAQIFEDVSALQSDSIILANEDNPNFVILDVRRPTEYNPEHLMGAINRNYYDDDFELQLDSLGKHKTYLLHCKSGGRSGATHDIMFDLGFDEVYNMSGGINAWKSNSLPTTDTFNSKLMLVSESFFDVEEIALGEVDTIVLTVTNRANALLIFDEICSLEHPEFSSDFDPTVTLEGAFDYTFNILYEPLDEIIDTLSFCIGSENESVETTIIRTGIDETTRLYQFTDNQLKVYPNPTLNYIFISSDIYEDTELYISDLQGRQVSVKSDLNQGKIDLTNLNAGQYILTVKNRDQIINQLIYKL